MSEYYLFICNVILSDYGKKFRDLNASKIVYSN